MARRLLRAWPAIAISVGAIVLVWTAWLGARGAGWETRVLGIRLSSRDPFRSLIVGAALSAIGLCGIRSTRITNRFPQWATACAAGLAITTVALAIVFGSFVAGAADAYGYVSQSKLWVGGSVIAPAPLTDDASWPDAAWALTPLGYRPAVQRGWMVPVYPAGLPLTMASLRFLFGEIGAYLVVPMMGGLAVWLTYVFGRELHGPSTGLFASAALLASPAFLLQLMAPMSDVPVTTWWLLAVILALKPDSARLVASGLAMSIAVITRPNLIVLGVPLLILVAERTRHVPQRRHLVLWWIAAAACGPIAVAILDARLYGSPLASGYGAVGMLFSPAYTLRNAMQYARWLAETQTPFIFLGIVAAPWMLRRVDARARSLIRWSFLFTAVVVASYLWYMPFDHWSYLRFLLPAYPMLLGTAATALIVAAERYQWRSGVVIALSLVLACSGFWQGRLAFSVAKGEARYAEAAELAAKLPADAIVISNLHSGSVRYYADRLTLRYEWLGPDAYQAALDYFRDHRRPVYAMLDDTEVDAFRQKYADVADVSWMTRAPLRTVANRVFLYELPNR